MGNANRRERSQDVPAQTAPASVPVPSDGSAGDADEKSIRAGEFADCPDLLNDIVEQKEVQQAVTKVLGELPEIYREVFVLRDMQHLDLAETAETLGLGQSSVKTRLHRASHAARGAHPDVR